MERFAGRIVLLWGWRRALVAFAVGALAVFAQAPYDFFAVCLVSFPVLVWLLDGATPDGKRGFVSRLAPAFSIGWWFGFGYFVAGLWWIGNALLIDAGAFAWALPLAVIALPACLALFYGFATALARLVWANDIGRIAALAVGFGLAEWLRAVLFTGFPWNAIGYAAMPVPVLMQPVALLGLFTVNTIAVFVFAMPALLAGDRDRVVGLLSAVLIVVAAVGFGTWRLAQPIPEDAQSQTVRIVQPSVDQSGKWDSSMRDKIFADQLALSAEPAEPDAIPGLIVWPETSVPFLLTDRPDALLAIGQMLQDGQMLMAGAVRTEGDATGTRYYNSIVAINSDGEIVDAADKVHLVPFGEYLPLSELLSTLGMRQLVNAPGAFSPGSSRGVLDAPNGARLLAMICYEIIFPREIAHTGDANAIINLTNDAWYGDTPGPYQHFRQAQVRAVESGLPLIRAANNGISAVVDSRGNVIEAFDLNVVGSLDARLTVGAMPVSPYKLHLFFAVMFIFATLACIKKLLSRSQPN